jgi:hypothetical protein
MAGAIAGALHGDRVIRPAWIDRIKAANRIDLDPIARGLADLARTLQERQLAAARERERAFAELLAAPRLESAR